MFLYIVPWSPGDFDKCLWSKTVHFSTLPVSPRPHPNPQNHPAPQNPSSRLCFLSPSAPSSPQCSLSDVQPPSAPGWEKVRARRALGKEGAKGRAGGPIRQTQAGPRIRGRWRGRRPGGKPRRPLQLPARPLLQLPPTPPPALSKWRRISSASASVSGCKTTPAPRSF